MGWNPVVVTPELEATWEPTTYEGITTWGHTPVGEGIVHKLTMFRHAVKSLASREPAVPLLPHRRPQPAGAR